MSNETALQIVDRTRDKLARLLPQNVDRDRFVHVLLSAMNQKGVAQCETNSLVKAAYGVAKLALNPDPILGHCYIIPRKGVATLQIGYRGYEELARRSRMIAGIHAEVVYANDEYTVELGSRPKIRHVPWDMLGKDQPGEVIGAYVTWIDMASGRREFHRINRSRIERAMRASESASAGFSPWKSDYSAMVRKTAIRDAAKDWPQSPELAAAVRWEEQAERDEKQELPDVPEVIDGVVIEDPLQGFGDDNGAQPAPADNGSQVNDELASTGAAQRSYDIAEHESHQQPEPPEESQDEGICPIDFDELKAAVVAIGKANGVSPELSEGMCYSWMKAVIKGTKLGAPTEQMIAEGWKMAQKGRGKFAGLIKEAAAASA